MRVAYKRYGKSTSAWDVDSNTRKYLCTNKRYRELSRRIRRMNRKTINREVIKWAL